MRILSSSKVCLQKSFKSWVVDPILWFGVRHPLIEDIPFCWSCRLQEIAPERHAIAGDLELCWWKGKLFCLMHFWPGNHDIDGSWSCHEGSTRCRYVQYIHGWRPPMLMDALGLTYDAVEAAYVGFCYGDSCSGQVRSLYPLLTTMHLTRNI